MKIDQIEFYHAVLKLKHPFVTSLASRDYANNVFVRIRTDEGVDGWGECSPSLMINGENVETCFSIGKLIAEQLIGESPLNIEDNIWRMNKVIYGNTSIKSAIDMALYDISSKVAGLPLYKFLEGDIHKKIHTDYTVGIASVEEMVRKAEEVKEMGFATMKVKLGDGGPKDVARIKAIRAAIGYDMIIRIDANQGWKVKEAIQTLQDLAPYNIQYCEEPINKKNYFRLRKVRNNSTIRIMADECLSDHFDARKLIRGNYCDYFNVKLGKSGGIFEAQKIIKEAEGSQIEMQIGGFLESRIGFTASCHLAHTSGLVKYYDFDSPLFMSVDPVIGGMEYQSDWEIKLPESPGLGIDVDHTFLRNTRQIHVN